MSGREQVVTVDYNVDTGKLFLEIRGHPTDCLHRALQIGQSILGSQPWRMVSCNYKCPMTLQYETEGSFACRMEVKRRG